MSKSQPIYMREAGIMDFMNMQPSTVKARANVGTEFWRRYLYFKLFSVFKFTLPADWRKNFFLYWLYQFGSIGVVYTREFGWVCQPYSIEKLDLYYNPKVICVNNQWVKNKRGMVGVNADVIHLTYDYFGVDDLVTRTAVKLAEIDKAINVNLMNCNLGALFRASSKKQADEIKEAYEKASRGEPLVVLDKDVLAGDSFEPFFPAIKNNYIVNDLLTAQHTILNDFLTLAGIKNANYDKKERLNSQEVNQNNDDVQSIISGMYDCISTAFKRINAFSGLGLSIEYAYDYSQGAPSEAGGVEND